MATWPSFGNPQLESSVVEPAWIEPILGLGLGTVGGALLSALSTTSLLRGLFLGGVFGLAFGLFFARRASSPGAGLIWGLSSALLLWIMLPAGILPILAGSGRSMGMLNDARAEFPELVAYMICLGMPLGLTLGIRGALRSREGQSQFSLGRAIIAGGLAGTLGGLIFGRWMLEGDFFPLLAGFG